MDGLVWGELGLRLGCANSMAQELSLVCTDRRMQTLSMSRQVISAVTSRHVGGFMCLICVRHAVKMTRYVMEWVAFLAARHPADHPLTAATEMNMWLIST